MSHEAGGSYVLDSEGSFVFVKGHDFREIGAEIELNPVIPINLARLSAIAACFVVFVVTAIFGWLWNSPGYSVFVDINPSVETVFNRLDRPRHVKPLCYDGAALISGISLRGDPATVVVSLIEEARQKGFLEEAGDSVSVFITVVARNGRNPERYADSISLGLERHGLRELAVIEVSDQSLLERADELGVSPGKLRLASQLYAMGVTVSLDDLLSFSVRSLALELYDHPAADTGVRVPDSNVRADTTKPFDLQQYASPALSGMSPPPVDPDPGRPVAQSSGRATAQAGNSETIEDVLTPGAEFPPPDENGEDYAENGDSSSDDEVALSDDDADEDADDVEPPFEEEHDPVVVPPEDEKPAVGNQNDPGDSSEGGWEPPPGGGPGSSLEPPPGGDPGSGTQIPEDCAHDWDDGDSFAPTRDADGYSVHACESCDETKTVVDSGSRIVFDRLSADITNPTGNTFAITLIEIYTDGSEEIYTIEFEATGGFFPNGATRDFKIGAYVVTVFRTGGSFNIVSVVPASTVPEDEDEDDNEYEDNENGLGYSSADTEAEGEERKNEDAYNDEGVSGDNVGE